jgi:hypothetical protein
MQEKLDIRQEITCDWAWGIDIPWPDEGGWYAFRRRPNFKGRKRHKMKK